MRNSFHCFLTGHQGIPTRLLVHLKEEIFNKLKITDNHIFKTERNMEAPGGSNLGQYHTDR